MFKMGTKITITVGLIVVGSVASADSLFENSDETQCTLQVVVRPVLPPNQILSKETINKFIPTNMTPGANANLFAAQFSTGVGQKISEDIVAGDLVRSSFLGKMTTKLEKFSQTSLLSAGKDSSGEKINVEFQIKAVERQAIISYKGFIHSEIIYAVDQSSFKWTLSRAINTKTTIALTSVDTPYSRTASSILSLSHSF
jgi:hypothetical protein